MYTYKIRSIFTSMSFGDIPRIARARSKLLRLLAAGLGLGGVGGELPPAGHRHLGRLRRGSAAVRHVAGIVLLEKNGKKPWLQL